MNLAKKVKNTNFKIAIESRIVEERKLNLLKKKFQQHVITCTGHLFPEKSRKVYIFFYIHVLYTETFTLEAYNSAKKQQMTELFKDLNQETRYCGFMKKQRLKSSCYYPFKAYHRLA